MDQTTIISKRFSKFTTANYLNETHLQGIMVSIKTNIHDSLQARLIQDHWQSTYQDT